MTRALRAIDRGSAGLALMTAAVSVLLGVQWPQAAAGGLAVLAFGLALERVARRRDAGATVPLAPMQPPPGNDPRAAEPRPAMTDLHAPYGRLTTRELEIAVLVAEGHTNREIADRLVLSERTIDNHLQHVMDKLGVHRRSQVSAWIAERRLLSKDRA